MAAVTALQGLSLGGRPEVGRAFEAVSKTFPAGDGRLIGHFHYGQFYAVQAAWHRDAKIFAAWYTRLRDHLLAGQRKDGGFDDPSVGDIYATAMSLFILEMPYHQLPVLVR
jgi:hypothetical protein